MAEQDLSALKPDALGPAAIEEKAEALGVGKANMKPGQAFLLALLAGFYIGMGGMFMILVKSDPSLSPAVSSILGGAAFCLGLFLVVTAGAELFTGNCLMICGKLSDKYSWGQLLKSWGIVWLGNLVGALVLVVVLYFARYWANAATVGDVTKTYGATMISVAAGKISQDWVSLFFRGIMCNVLVCAAVWVGFGSRTIVDKFFAVFLPITAFVACGFEHCVANMFFLPMGIVMNMSGQVDTSAIKNAAAVTVGGGIYNLVVVTLGNIVGGALFIGVMYWAAYAKGKKVAAK